MMFILNITPHLRIATYHIATNYLPTRNKMPPKTKVSSTKASPAPRSSRSGLILRGRWKLGKLLGEGACGQVFEAVDITGSQSEHQWVIKLTPLPDAASVQKKNKQAMALKRNADTLYMEQLAYKNYLMGVPSIPALPTQLAYGEDQGFRFLVMQRLGPDLIQDFEAAGKSYSPSKLANLGKQILACLRRLHERQLIFVDVKPENFMLGLKGSSEADTVFMLDFGLVEKYTANTGAHKPQEHGGSTVGTPLFSSIACHSGSTPARRDDIESLGMILLYFALGGNFPWSTATSDEDCLKKKKAASLKELVKGYLGGDILRQFIELARNTAYEATPAYTQFASLLDRLGKVKEQSMGQSAKAESQDTDSGDNLHKPNGGVRKRNSYERRSSSTAAAASDSSRKGKKKNVVTSPPRTASSSHGKNKKIIESVCATPESPSGWLARAAGVGKSLLKSIGGGNLTTSGGADEQEIVDLTAGGSSEKKKKKKKQKTANSANDIEQRRNLYIADEDEDVEEEKGRRNSRGHSKSNLIVSLALEGLAGPYKGKLFPLNDAGGFERPIYLGSGLSTSSNTSSNIISLPQDTSLQSKHIRLEPSGRTSIHSLKVVPLAGAKNVSINGVELNNNKTGRMVFLGDLIQVGHSTFALRRGS